MDLDTWMQARKLTDQEVADATGLSRGYFNRVRNGVVHISLGTALSILAYTDNQVDLERLLPVRLRPWRPVKPWKPHAARDTSRTRPERKASRSRAGA
jgi:transcriptional regulator with XRE-family HTH domain